MSGDNVIDCTMCIVKFQRGQRCNISTLTSVYMSANQTVTHSPPYLISSFTSVSSLMRGMIRNGVNLSDRNII
jgi:hypothetical protein